MTVRDCEAGGPGLKVLVLGQTPPPYGGQSMMLQLTLNHAYEGVTLFHVRMHFSNEMDEVGRIRLKKVIHLFSVVFRVVWKRLRHGTTVLYYPPAGPDLVPVLRDILILMSTRWLFRRTVFHFHAGGVSELYQRLPPLVRWFYRKAYFYPDLAIRLSEYNPPDGARLHARREFIVPNGIADITTPSLAQKRKSRNKCRILYVGVLTASKGIFQLVKAGGILRRSGVLFEMVCVGRFASRALQRDVEDCIRDEDVADSFSFPGVLVGSAKEEAYRTADVFCYPTAFPSETFGLVLLEAMRHELPLVGTRWRGVQSLVRDGRNGFLVDVGDAEQLADRLQHLLKESELRLEMGRQSRELFLKEYTIEKFYHRMNAAFQSLQPGCAQASG